MKLILHSHRLSWLIVLISCASYAQWQNDLWTGKQAYNWYFGEYAGLNFDTSPPTSLSDGQTGPITSYYWDPVTQDFDFNRIGSGLSGTSCMSDSEGNLLFYTNGHTVWNKNHQIMVNGQDLLNSSTYEQSTIIIAVPGNTHKYYIFSVKQQSYDDVPNPVVPAVDPMLNPRIVYSEVDMSLDNGLGAVTPVKNVIISTDSFYSDVTATYHSDGKQIWVLFANVVNNTQFEAFLVTEDGVNLTSVKSDFNSSPFPPAILESGQMKFSPDGKKLVKSLPSARGLKVEVYDFNKETGEVTNLIVLLNQQDFAPDGEILGPMGLEFSPNSKFLYTAGRWTGIVKQFNLEAGSAAQIKASAVIISEPTDPQQFNNFMQAAPDGKIYITYAPSWTGRGTDEHKLNVINYPNNEGVNSGFQTDAIVLVSGISLRMLPNFIQNYFASGILHEGKCEGEAVTFSTIRIPGITSITWDFGDPGSGENNASTDIEPTHIFSSEGTYTVTAIITSNGAQQTAITTVTIIPAPVLSVPSINDLTKCADVSGTTNFDLEALDTIILADQNIEDFTITYFASQEDLEADVAIAAPDTFITAGQVVYALATNTVTGCTSTIQFELVVNPLPELKKPKNMEQCGDTSALAVFDLTQQTPVILNNLNPEDYNVNFYRNSDFTDEIQEPEFFESAGQVIFTSVTNIATGCSASIQFDVLVLLLPTLPEITTFEICSPFDLNTLLDKPEAGTIFSFYVSEENALGNINAITNADRYIVEGNTGSVYVRVINRDGCVQVGELFLKSGNCFMPRGISPNNDGKNDTFDLSGFDVKVLKIFNRYGKEVYSKSDYTNEWAGKSNKGDELPSGTYYYMIESGNGESKTGWVYINR